MTLPAEYVKQRTLKITTKGRKTGNPHTVTIWFGVDEKGRMFVASLRNRDWVKNILANPEVEIKVKDLSRRMKAYVVESEEDKQTVQQLWRKKYGLLARLLRLPRKDGIIFELKQQQ
ncbi:MAG: nitroreductase family deazaflavin-dependent oxidoreductase [Candidatus Caldarchaeum sp.]|nr:nitroreductase family deazaflavin-dependent oxidoreductase [Candidatus Caldarchaeum sp.]MDW8359108.1 nitroreductase family deazaflavin-dependent oxidoreductase [Candidatus Caldarchaeum sp.]